jgi:hypothetical protein
MAVAEIGSWLVTLAGPLVRKALVSLGIGVASYAAIVTALNAALDHAKSAWGGLSGDALSLIQMAGCGEALSIVAGALVARVGLMSLKKLEILA